MIKMDQYMDIKQLKAEGHSIREITRITGHSRNTVRRVLRDEQDLKMKPRPKIASILNPYKGYIKQRYLQYQLSAVKLLAEIKPQGYTGSITTIRRYLQTLKQKNQYHQKLTVRYETPPGQQAQADWMYCGKFYPATADHDQPLEHFPQSNSPTSDKNDVVRQSGKRNGVSIYAFVMVLSFSRMLFIRFTTSMKMPHLITCHQEAFRFFGGVPVTILYDNMKQVKISRSQWNEQLLDFAGHHGYTPKTHRPYRPRTKGKVERPVHYVKNNFMAGETFSSVNDLNARGSHWLNHTANVRIHATTKRRPIDLFNEHDQSALTPIDQVPVYRFVDPVTRKVNWESMVHFKGSRYSVPPEYAGKNVEVASEGGHLFVRQGDMIIAEHKQAVSSGQCIVDKEHLAELWKITQQQIRLPDDATRWNVNFSQAVQQTPLSKFEEVLV